MPDESFKDAYYALFNCVTDVCAELEEMQDQCVLMEAAPGYTPGDQASPRPRKKRDPQKPPTV